MELKKIQSLMFMSIVFFGSASVASQDSKKNQKNKETIVGNTVSGKSFSWSLPNWTDTVGGIVLAGATYAAQMKYMSGFFEYLKDCPSSSSTASRFFWNNAQYIPVLVVGLWSFFELRQITASGLYNRAMTIVDRINEFKSLEMSFESVEHFMNYLAYHGSAKELRIINDEYQYVTTHIFLSSLLQELTYALRLLERSTGWVSDAAMLAKIDKIMFEVRANIRHLKHNKLLLENHPHYNLEYARYQQDRQLLQQDRLTTVAEDQNALTKVKFVFDTIGKIVSFFSGKSSSKQKA